jgi:LysR family glycine cleavage system transcriptional activator
MIGRPWLPLNALRAFEAVGQHGGFTAAAAALNVSQSAVSRHVISLEATLGVQLLERRPGGLALTPAGQALLPVLARAFDRVQSAVNRIADGQSALRRVLRLHLSPSFAQRLAVPILRSFRETCPDLLLDISSSGSLAPPRDVDAGVIYTRYRPDELICDLLWMVGVTPLCSPEVADRHAGLPLDEFLARNELLHVKVEGELRHQRWLAFVRACGMNLDVGRGLSFDTAVLAAEYALSGGGVALLDWRLFADEIAAGRLVAPYPQTLEDGFGYFVSVAPEDLEDPAIGRLRSWLIAGCGAEARRAEAVMPRLGSPLPHPPGPASASAPSRPASRSLLRPVWPPEPTSRSRAGGE